MNTCFLFAEFFDEEHCLSLCLDEQGHEQAPIMRRTVDELRLLQENARTIVIFPTKFGGIHEVELPWIAVRKARAALLFALEEELADSVNVLHVAFDREHYQQGRYLVVVIEKNIIQTLMAKLERLNIRVDAITLDWFALKFGEACIIQDDVLVYDATFKGAFSIELLDYYRKHQTQYSHILTFTDNPPVEHVAQYTAIESSAYDWLAARLLKSKFIDLCQGEFQDETHQLGIKRWHHLAGLLGGASLLMIFFMNAIMLFLLKKEVAHDEAKIAAVYHQFFPESHQVVSPKFRISQLLTNNQSKDAALWSLLTKLTEVIAPNSVMIQQLSYQKQTLTVSFQCQDFSLLEQIESKLKAKQVKVHQVSAAKEANQVHATLILN